MSHLLKVFFKISAEVLDWLYSIDLITEEDKERGMQLFEEWLAKRRED